jgi:small subunit ribosomal protein S3
MLTLSAIKNVMKNNYRMMELDEYLNATLKDAGYGGSEIQKTPIGTKITLFVTRPGLAIGRKGAGIKDLTLRLEQQFGLSNPQVSVMEVTKPELNPKIMANRIAHNGSWCSWSRSCYCRKTQERTCPF